LYRDAWSKAKNRITMGPRRNIWGIKERKREVTMVEKKDNPKGQPKRRAEGRQTWDFRGGEGVME